MSHLMNDFSPRQTAVATALSRRPAFQRPDRAGRLQLEVRS